MYDRERRRDRGGSRDGLLLEDSGRSESPGGDNTREGRSGRSEDCFAGVGHRGACGFEVVLERGRGSGADEIRLLCRRSSSACSVRTGDEERPDSRRGLVVWCSKRAIASVTGTLLGVVWLKSSRRRAICLSSRSASRSMTWSIDERDRRCALVGMVADARLGSE